MTLGPQTKWPAQPTPQSLWSLLLQPPSWQLQPWIHPPVPDPAFSICLRHTRKAKMVHTTTKATWCLHSAGWHFEAMQHHRLRRPWARTPPAPMKGPPESGSAVSLVTSGKSPAPPNPGSLEQPTATTHRGRGQVAQAKSLTCSRAQPQRWGPRPVEE